MHQVIGLFALFGIFAAIADIDLPTDPYGECPRTFSKDAHRQEHPSDVGVYQQWVGGLLGVACPTKRTALLTITRILDRGLVGAFPQAQSLDADTESGIIHHGEHRPHTLVRFTDQPAGGALQAHLAGGRSLDSHLAFYPCAAYRVALARFSIIVGQKFGHKK